MRSLFAVVRFITLLISIIHVDKFKSIKRARGKQTRQMDVLSAVLFGCICLRNFVLPAFVSPRRFFIRVLGLELVPLVQYLSTRRIFSLCLSVLTRNPTLPLGCSDIIVSAPGA